MTGMIRVDWKKRMKQKATSEHKRNNSIDNEKDGVYECAIIMRAFSRHPFLKRRSMDTRPQSSFLALRWGRFLWDEIPWH